MHPYQNPVIPGYHPDPSIVRVGEDFYLVTSTFEFFPGVPIYHSKNLVNWELIGHCLTDDAQLPLSRARNSGGIFAPTIRYHDGMFYMVTTNIDNGGNFVVHTDDIRGKWSKPAWIDHQGIDPSLLFDGDTVYYCATHFRDGRAAIVLYEINPVTGELLTPARVISHGAGGKFPEAPHLYKIGGYFYLMMAEGGTEYGHMETIFRSKDPYGPYKPCPHNPILSHRDAMGSPVQATGHADLVEDARGNWWMVFLGIRPFDHAMLHNLGRETFLAPVAFDREGWPVVAGGGRVALSMSGPLPFAPMPVCFDFFDDFKGMVFKPEWSFVRNPLRDRYCLTGNGLCLHAGEESLDDRHPTALMVRQQGFFAHAEADLMLDDLPEGGMAGIVAYYNTDYHYAACVSRLNGRLYARLSKAVHDIRAQGDGIALDEAQALSLRVVADKRRYAFYCKAGGDWLPLGSGSSAGLCTEGTMTMTFTGAHLGIFAARRARVSVTRFSLRYLTPQKDEALFSEK